MNIFVIGAIAAILWWGASGVWHGVKKGAHAFGCMIVHGRDDCVKKSKLNKHKVNDQNIPDSHSS